MINILSPNILRACMLAENTSRHNLKVEMEVLTPSSFRSVRRIFVYFILDGEKIGTSLAFYNLNEADDFLTSLHEQFKQINAPLRVEIPLCG